MRLYPEKLASHLQQQLLPVYLVSGDEPLLVQECCDQIRARAVEQGCSEEDKQRIEQLFEQSVQDRSRAFELKSELDRLGVFKDYEDRFLDLFRK